MTSPDTLRSALVTKLKAIAALVTLLGGDADNIVEYVEENEGDSFGAIARLAPPCLLVMYTGTTPATGRELWRHNFSIIVRVSGSPAAIYKQIVDGVPTGGSGVRMLMEPLAAGVHPMEIPALQRRVIPVSDQSSFDYWEILIAFTEIGG